MLVVVLEVGEVAVAVVMVDEENGGDGGVWTWCGGGCREEEGKSDEDRDVVRRIGVGATKNSVMMAVNGQWTVAGRKRGRMDGWKTAREEWGLTPSGGIKRENYSVVVNMAS